MQPIDHIPLRLQAGDTLQWREYVPGYLPLDGWALRYRLTNQHGAIDIASTAAGDYHAIAVLSPESAAWAAGTYTAIRILESGAQRHSQAVAQVTVLPDYAALGAVDARSPAQAAMEDLRAALRQWLASKGHVQQYTIAGRSMTFASADEIRKRLALAQREVDTEALAEGRPTGRRKRVLVRF